MAAHGSDREKTDRWRRGSRRTKARGAIGVVVGSATRKTGRSVGTAMRISDGLDAGCGGRSSAIGSAACGVRVAEE
jgi:hypothetical protein